MRERDAPTTNGDYCLLSSDLVLLIARLDGSAAIIELEKIPFPLDEVLEDCIEFVRSKADGKQIEIVSKLQFDLSVLGDGQQLQRLFLNLIENVVQYTSTGGKVTVSLVSHRPEAIVTVEDMGIGIAPEELSHVFDRLWRSDRARCDRPEGTGLGMAIARTLTRAHGGTIEVTSEVGVGSCFQVRLPIFDKEEGQ